MEDAALVVDAAGTILFGNARACRMLGYPPGELTGKPLEALIPRGLRGSHAVHHSEYFERPRTRPMGVGISLSALCKDGITIPVEISLTPIEADGAPSCWRRCATSASGRSGIAP